MGKTCEVHPERQAAGFCVKCGKGLCEECAQQISGRNFCTSCLSDDLRGESEEKDRETRVLVEKERRTAANRRITPKRPKPSRTTSGITAKEIRRVVASTIDFILLIVVSVPFSWALMQMTILVYKEVHGIGYTLSFYIVFTIISSIYFIFLHWRLGMTAGKFLMKLKVVGYDGSDRITLMQSFWRWTGFMTGVIWAYIGYWFASRLLGFMAVFKDKLPGYVISLSLAAGIVFTGIFSLGLLITFVGKYKRGFHDLLGATIVRLEQED